jgi:hypothetical protein
MPQRERGYERKPLDQYETPAWVTLALIVALRCNPQNRDGQPVRSRQAIVLLMNRPTA